MKIILILALIFIAQGVDAIEVGLIQESGQIQNTYIYNSAFCSPPPDCEEGYFTESDESDGIYLCDSSFLDKIKLEPQECAYGYCYYEYDDDWILCDSESCYLPCGMIIYSDQLLPRSEQAECPPLPEPMVVVPRLGSVTFKPPEPESLISTSQ